MTPLFEPSYARARESFLAAVQAAGGDLHSHPHPLLGVDGEPLAMDVARFGAADAKAVLIISSACHGVEGVCGSAVQRALLADPALHAEADAAGVALLYVHALNPWGYSWWRRTTHENVDLNRNVHDFSQPLPANPAYDALAPFIVPRTWPSPEADARLQAFAAEHGMAALQAAISGGQHDHPEGLFYGGRAPTWSQQTLRHVLQDHARHCHRLGWIDVHTALGPSGHAEKIFAGRDDAAALTRARTWWGDEVTSIHDGSSSSARLTGMLCLAVYDECPQADYTGMALEYGTLTVPEVLHALRADQWLENHPETDADVRAAIKRQTLAAFYTDTEVWKQQILAQAFPAVRQALRGLSA